MHASFVLILLDAPLPTILLQNFCRAWQEQLMFPTSDLFLTFAKFHSQILQFFPFLVHCCLCCGKFHGLRCRNKFVYKVAVNCPLFLQYGLHDDSVKILPHAALWIHWLPKIHALARHNGSHQRFQFLASILDGLFEFLVTRVNEINSS